MTDATPFPLSYRVALRTAATVVAGVALALMVVEPASALGPTVAPSPPSLRAFASTQPLSTWMFQSSAAAVLSPGAGNTPSEIAGYAIVWDNAADTVPAAQVTTATSASSSQQVSASSLASGSWWVHARAVGFNGVWGETTHLGPYLLDMTKPLTPTVTFVGVVGGVTLADSATAAWSSTDADSGIKGYLVSTSQRDIVTGSGTASAGLPTFTPSVGVTLPVRPGMASCVLVGAQDNATAISTPAGACVSSPLSSVIMKRSKGWSRLRGRSARGMYRAAAVNSMAAGASLKQPLAVTSGVVLVVTTCPKCGKVEVRLTGRRSTTINLRSAKTRHSQIIAVPKSPVSASGGLLELRVASTGHPVTIEGVGTMPT